MMIQNVLTTAATAFRGGAVPQQLHVAQADREQIPMGTCEDAPDCSVGNAYQWYCDNNDGCIKTCITRHNDGSFNPPLTNYHRWECAYGSGPSPTNAPETTKAPQPATTKAPQPATTKAPESPATIIGPNGPCIPVDPQPTEGPVDPQPTQDPSSPDAYTPPPRNDSKNWKYNAFGTGQAGNASYADIMGVTPQELVGGVLSYHDKDSQANNSVCMWCQNIWGLEWNDPVSNLNADGSYKTHTEFRDVSLTKMNYKDYSASSAADDYIVGAYVTEWSVYRSTGKYGIDAVPFNQALDYILYGFMPVCGKGTDNLGQLGLCTVQDCTDYGADSNPYFALNQACAGLEPGTVVVHDPWSAFAAYSSMMDPAGTNDSVPKAWGGFHLLMNAKAEHKENIRIMPSVGGWSLSKMYFDMHDEKIRHNFVNSAANLLTAWPFFDGIDIDWEFPGGLGADAGEVKYAASAETQATAAPFSPAWNDPANCIEQSIPSAVDDLPRTLYSSWMNLGLCDKFESSSVETVQIPPLGCASKMSKRQEIADGYKFWGQYGSKTKEQYLNCECDANIGHKLFTDLRAALDNVPLSERPSEFGHIEKYQITTATSGAPGKINEVDYGRLVAEGSIDHIFIMSYDFMGAWSQQVGHQTNLFAYPEGAPGAKATEVAISQSVQAFLTQGVPSEKILVGVASYGRGWTGSFSAAYSSEDLQAAYDTVGTGACKGDIEDGVVDYNTIYTNTSSGSMKQLWDECAFAHFTVGQTEAYTGDSVESVWAKGDFVKRNNLGGLFTWELSQDSHEAPLINAMNEALGRVPSEGSVVKPADQYTDVTKSTCYAELDHVQYSSRDFNINCE